MRRLSVDTRRKCSRACRGSRRSTFSLSGRSGSSITDSARPRPPRPRPRWFGGQVKRTAEDESVAADHDGTGGRARVRRIGAMNLFEEVTREPWTPELAFPMAEYERRLARVREGMAVQDLDVLLVSNTSNIGYLTGYDTTMPSGYTVLVVPARGEVTLHCSELEAPCMLMNGWVRRIEVFYWYAAQDTGTDLARILVEGGYAGKRVGLEMGYAETFASGAFDTRSFLRLQEHLAGSVFVDATRLVLEVRLVKTEQELAYMRTAGTYSWAGLQAGLAACREGATDTEVIGDAYRAL